MKCAFVFVFTSSSDCSVTSLIFLLLYLKILWAHLPVIRCENASIHIYLDLFMGFACSRIASKNRFGVRFLTHFKQWL